MLYLYMDQSDLNLNNFELTKVYGGSLRKTLEDPVVREVFRTITVLTVVDDEGDEGDEEESGVGRDKISFDELNEEMSKMKESEVLRSVRALEDTPLIEEEVDIDFSDPTNTNTFYTVSELPEELEDHLDVLLAEIDNEFS